MEETNTNRERLKEMFIHYGLNKEDIFKHKSFGFVIVTRTGIEKIMAKDNITLTYEVVRCETDFAAVKCTASMDSKNGVIKIPTYGTAQTKNCQSTYYLEMAEKRAKARAVLQITNFYSLGVYSEVESDEFRKPITTQNNEHENTQTL
jgi:hypothetical protein|tara:strand:+ start:447 stop:890 length:444 start_codon:yes stop_codon:yes gene_type:complete